MTPDELLTNLDKRLRDVENQLVVDGEKVLSKLHDRVKVLEIGAESWLSKEGRLFMAGLSTIKRRWVALAGLVVGFALGSYYTFFALFGRLY